MWDRYRRWEHIWLLTTRVGIANIATMPHPTEQPILCTRASLLSRLPLFYCYNLNLILLFVDR